MCTRGGGRKKQINHLAVFVVVDTCGGEKGDEKGGRREMGEGKGRVSRGEGEG